MYHKNFSFIYILSILLCSSAEAMKRNTEKNQSYCKRVKTNTERQPYSNVVFYQCNEPDCRYVARTDSMEEHKERHSNPGKYFKCHVCDFLASTEGGLNKHITSMHSEEENTNLMTCLMCGVSGQDLSRHYTTYHKPLWSKRFIVDKQKHNKSFPLHSKL